MQFLYALERQKEAFHQIGKEYSGGQFNPDLNSLEEQDLSTLKALKNDALNNFDLYLVPDKIESTTLLPEVEIAIKDGLIMYENLLKEAQKAGFKNLVEEAERILHAYHKILWLPISWCELIKEDWNRIVAEGKDAGSGYRNLLSNPVIKAIEKNEGIGGFVKKHKIAWDTHTSQDWLRKIVKKDPLYSEYIENSQPSIADHKEIVNHLFKRIIFKNEVIDSYMEEHDLGWSENRGILKSMLIKTIKTYKEDKNTIELINLSPNWSEDEGFYKKLYKETVEGDSELEKIIAAKSKNWDSERIAAVDMILMKMAITEFRKFPSIPVKVTINEYIEICKAYSTPKSKQYVNGILDVISIEMVSGGEIKKSGRGLLDNK